ncbi:envelope stress response membrane protein PspB [Paraglaciecola sp.]|jgi:phage shock protein B|uniref:envelope stress response membrane protein PspB n=1 Tax=Paraglaciecola sp. TaxID=1920173 RepID=UPI00273D0D1F|nr:envelope stress response membrane protein PspB [Paraglaciecola sp.]MBU1436381.1 envelope stress response membrane protein PspB [Gammaproteobacteria bacterium]MBU2180382.1 envelope stress response membrane protein PspB [Gammaproteobacteria bacterium]MBU2225245.1 envelope stress response membrane protein PspB [Gammaproteobacteria bacterium]MBU2277483.1 envelope stress response membrane protein PspB [Gammaproteobacteria bacterium]MBU2428637.1 envelope stress response membrane protein PspB [Gam
MGIHEAFGVPLILFMIFVAPIWVIMHYRSKRKISEGLSETELNQLNDLSNRAEKMADRIKTLEAILDAESPNWRRDHDKV